MLTGHYPFCLLRVLPYSHFSEIRIITVKMKNVEIEDVAEKWAALPGPPGFFAVSGDACGGLLPGPGERVVWHVLCIPGRSRSERMNKTFLAVVALSAVVSTLAAIPAWAAPAYPIYRETRGRWVGALDDTRVYSSLEDARKGVAREDEISVWNAFVLLGENGDWLHLADEDGDEFWAAASAFTDLDSFLKDPPPGALVNCEGYASNTFRVDLDDKRKKAWILMHPHPTLTGGARIIEIWDRAKTTLLWHSGPLDKTGRDNLLYCGQDGDRRLQLAGDVDGDGKAELVIKDAQSEIGPGTFFFLRWNGEAFVPVLEKKQFFVVGQNSPDIFPAIGDEDALGNLLDGRKRIWVDDFLAADGDGSVIASLTILEKDAQGEGRARLRPDKDWNMVFEKWEGAPIMEPF